MHILDNPPYRVLLGRPFDTLTSSVVRTNGDGDSEVILTDPNTMSVVTVPTYSRGAGLASTAQKQQYQGF